MPSWHDNDTPSTVVAIEWTNNTGKAVAFEDIYTIDAFQDGVSLVDRTNLFIDQEYIINQLDINSEYVSNNKRIQNGATKTVLYMFTLESGTSDITFDIQPISDRCNGSESTWSIGVNK